MSNLLLGQSRIESLALMAFAGWLMLSIVAILRLEVFRGKTIAGPARLNPDETPLVPFGIMAVMFVVSSMVLLFLTALIQLPASAKLLVTNSVAYIVGAAAIIIATAVGRRNGISLFGLKPDRVLRGIGAGALALMIIYPLMLVIEVLTGWLLRVLNFSTPAPHPILKELTESGTPSHVAGLMILAAVLAPIFEEMLFRGLIQTGLARWLGGTSVPPGFMVTPIDPVMAGDVPSSAAMNEPGAVIASPSPRQIAGRWIAVIATSLLFAAVHGEPAFVPPLLLLAIALGYMYERTGNLWACITLHSLFNLSQMLIVLAGK